MTDFLVANMEKASVLLPHFLAIADAEFFFRSCSSSLDCFLSISKSEGPLGGCGANRCFFPPVELTPLSGALLEMPDFCVLPTQATPYVSQVHRLTDHPLFCYRIVLSAPFLLMLLAALDIHDKSNNHSITPFVISNR